MFVVYTFLKLLDEASIENFCWFRRIVFGFITALSDNVSLFLVVLFNNNYFLLSVVLSRNCLAGFFLQPTITLVMWCIVHFP